MLTSKKRLPLWKKPRRDWSMSMPIMMKQRMGWKSRFQRWIPNWLERNLKKMKFRKSLTRSRMKKKWVYWEKKVWVKFIRLSILKVKISSRYNGITYKIKRIKNSSMFLHSSSSKESTTSLYVKNLNSMIKMALSFTCDAYLVKRWNSCNDQNLTSYQRAITWIVEKCFFLELISTNSN